MFKLGSKFENAKSSPLVESTSLKTQKPNAKQRDGDKYQIVRLDILRTSDGRRETGEGHAFAARILWPVVLCCTRKLGALSHLFTIEHSGFRPLASFGNIYSQQWPQLRFTHPNFILLFLSISISIVLPAKGLDEQYHACGRGVGPRQFDWWCLKPHARLQLMHAYAVSTFGAHRHAVEIFNSPCPTQLRF